MKKFLFSTFLTIGALALPLTTFAAGCVSGGTPQDFSGFVCIFIDLFSTAIPIVAAIALLIFFWGLAKFILKAGEESAREEGKEVMKWGIVALFVLVSIWSIVFFLTNDVFGTSSQLLPILPS